MRKTYFKTTFHPQKPRAGLSTAIASESSLRKDWLKPEEEKAWRRLPRTNVDRENERC